MRTKVRFSNEIQGGQHSRIVYMCLSCYAAEFHYVPLVPRGFAAVTTARFETAVSPSRTIFPVRRIMPRLRAAFHSATLIRSRTTAKTIINSKQVGVRYIRVTKTTAIVTIRHNPRGILRDIIYE